MCNQSIARECRGGVHMKVRLAIAAFGAVMALSGVTAFASTHAQSPNEIELPDWLAIQAVANL